MSYRRRPNIRPLDRLTGFSRGTLSSSGHNGSSLDTVTTLNSNTNLAGLSGSQSWNLDAQGNQSAVTTDGTTQDRTSNNQNELTTLTTGTNTTTLTYDNNGLRRAQSSRNLLTDDHGGTLLYDAWNRLSQYNTDLLGNIYYYYGDGRSAANQFSSLYGGAAFIPDAQGRTIQEMDPDNHLERENVWSGGWGSYVNDMIQREQFRYQDPDTYENIVYASPVRLYAQHDVNHNVTSIADTGGTVQERFVYDSYGKSATLDASYSTPVASNVARVDWNFKFQGGRLDNDSALYTFGWRNYSPTLGWTTAEPFGAFYIDGTNLYKPFGSNPIARVDPTGLLGVAMQPFGGGGSMAMDRIAEENREFAARPVPGSYDDEYAFWSVLGLAGENQNRAVTRALGCVSRCIEANDPLNLLEKGALTGIGGPIPKTLVTLFGGRVVRLPGSSPFTTLPSIASVQMRLGGSSALRATGRMSFYAWLVYSNYMALVEARCACKCGSNPQSY